MAHVLNGHKRYPYDGIIKNVCVVNNASNVTLQFEVVVLFT